MIIVSQDKTKIINFDNVENVNFEKCYNGSIREEDFTFDIVAYMVSDELVRIAQYKTEERAKKVLQEIINAIECWEDFKAGMPHDTPNFKYEMPKE